MTRVLVFRLAALGMVALGVCQGQTHIESYEVYTEHPRLFLRAQRMRLLKRERERNSMRWQQFQALMSGNAPMAEPGFAYALYAAITDDPGFARKAVTWANSPGSDLRQVAIVFDWCQSQLTESDKQALAAILRRGLIEKPKEFADWRSQVLAAVALAGDDDAASQKTLQAFVEGEWLGQIIPALRTGKPAFGEHDSYALLETLHAVRDNLNADLREDFPQFFRQFPLFDLLSYYPAPFPSEENEFHIPYSSKIGQPDLKAAALSRAGELAMVAYDTNSPESQVLQGWLMDDRFLMRGLLGSPYEFLWANPYQPGLSYYHVPLVLHDEILGRLLVRSSWDDDARWAGFIDGNLQEFHDGRVVAIDPKQASAPLDLDEATIAFAGALDAQEKFESGKKEVNDIFVVGVRPRTPYQVEIDDQEMQEYGSDPGGILYFKGVRPETAIRFEREPSQP